MNVRYFSESPTRIGLVSIQRIKTVAHKGVRRGQPRTETVENYRPVLNPTSEQVEHVLLNCQMDHVLQVAAANQGVDVGPEAVARVMQALDRQQRFEQAARPASYVTPEGFAVEDSEDGPYLVSGGRFIRYLTDEEYNSKIVENNN